MKNKNVTALSKSFVTKFIVTLVVIFIGGFAHNVRAEIATSGTSTVAEKNTNINILADAIDGKIIITANAGYVYHFGGKPASLKNSFGYGASIGYTNSGGFGFATDYLSLNRAGNSGGYDYAEGDNIITLTPSYRFDLDDVGLWGLRIGVGAGVNIAKRSYTATAAGNAQSGARGGARVAGNAFYSVVGQDCSYYLDNDSDGGATCNVPGAQTKVNTSTLNSEIAQLFLSGAITYTKGIIDFGVWRDMVKTVDGLNKIKGKPLESIATGKQFANAYIAGYATIANPDPQFLALAQSIANSALVTIPFDVYTAAALTPTQMQSLVNAGATFATASVSNDAGNGDNALPSQSIGFAVVPQIALDYDNGLFHADINLRCIYAVAIKNAGNSMVSNIEHDSDSLAIFAGAGLGLNF
ncbi:MAG: hypothetical protein QM529_03855 [Hydrotalea sp.]|nr:hypothetical protein [Hydrotalea sp.]